MSGKLCYAGVFRADTKPAFELWSASDPSKVSRFYHSTIQEFFTFYSKTVAERTQLGQRQVVTQDSYVIYSFAKSDGLTGVVITNHDYPKFTAHQLVSDVLDAFAVKIPKTTWSKATAPIKCEEAKECYKKFENPGQVDGISKVQQELDDTKDVLHKTIESVLERGEKIETLMAKSDGLSTSSRQFYTSAKGQNGCCTMM
ncbi:hypothetical protein AMS68_000807 [Peltaster fructicola]|uniref:Synaptobrevin homolog YKT6 n=1 Tax=Peltaster fructicola TaxID=286661 RepID=A0A6H0XLB3_9PEZI|nr:hypothetical protein AMS68_000807 [Peltaster fructicola]